MYQLKAFRDSLITPKRGIETVPYPICFKRQQKRTANRVKEKKFNSCMKTGFQPFNQSLLMRLSHKTKRDLK